MKELSIEEKAKAYDKAIEKAKNCLKDGTITNTAISYIGTIFPELIESEDERVRKAIHIYFDWLDGRKDYAPKGKYTIRDMIAWLEKQGEQEQDPCDNCKDVMLNCHNFPCIKKRAFKQGKSVLGAIIDEKVDNANKVEPKDYSSIAPHFGKPIDKVEPKFKQGQWIIWKDKCYKVNYNGCGYELIDQNGLSTSLEYGTVDTSARLWDVIQDAKAGDVLQLGKVTAIFQNYISNKECRCYCSVFDGEFEIPVQYADTYGCHNAVPATKEQRDTLMKAMVDAGYAFDFEKKELKKIKDEIEIPFGAKDSELQGATYYIPKGFHAEIDGDKVVVKKGEKPTAWSEEDEKMLNSSVDNLTELMLKYGEKYGNVGKCIDWLKSLRPQNTWKPSDAQMIALNDVITNGHLSNANERILKGLQEQLKKLK